MRLDGHNQETTDRSGMHFMDGGFRPETRDLTTPATTAPPFPFELREVTDDAGSGTTGAPRATRTDTRARLKDFEGDYSAIRSSLHVS
jgi:hypothetical protein